MDETYSLTEEHAKEWQSSSDLNRLLELADDVFTARHLRLFRASCCATLLPFVDDGDWAESVKTFELAAENRATLRQHNDMVERALGESRQRLLLLREERIERIIGWCFQEAAETDNPPEITERIQRRMEYAQNNPWTVENLAHALFELFPDNRVIQSLWYAVESVNWQFISIGAIVEASLYMSDWDVTEDIERTLKSHQKIAKVRTGIVYPTVGSYRSDWEVQSRIYQELHCNIFRELVPGPDFDSFRVAPWRQPGVLFVAREIDESRDFLQLHRLSEALEDAKCVDAQLHLHCLRSDPAIRGSWLVDLLLDKQD